MSWDIVCSCAHIVITLQLIKRREKETARICVSAFEREQKRARPRTDEHSLTYRSAGTNGRCFVYQTCVTAESWFAYLDTEVSKDALARRAIIAKVAMTTGLCSLLGWLAFCYLLKLTGSSARCWNTDMWLCCLVTLWSFCLGACIQTVIWEVCIVNLELLFPILNIYVFF